MDTKREVISFINSKESNGALLVTGKWGCGKSYVLKNIVDELNEGADFAVSIVSLFGIDSIVSFNSRVKDAYLEVNSSLLGNSARKVYKALAKVAKESAAVYAAASPDSPTAAAISVGASSVVSMNPFNAVNVKNIVGIGDRKKQFILVFDDFERCKISRIDLLGAINDYTENRRIKTILIADESKITNDNDEKVRREYKEFKEKLVSRTIKLVPDYEEAITSIIKGYKETEPGYIGFLQENTSVVQQVFYESKTENLRSLKAYLMDFERVFATWKEAGIPIHDINPVFYMFGAMTFGVKSGMYTADAYGFLFKDSEMKETYARWNATHMLSSLKSWIIEGIWDKHVFLQEVRNKYRVGDMSNFEKFISLNFWDLEQENISEGMPIAVKKAYEGSLTCDDLISLLQKVAALKKYEVSVPIDVDYTKIYKGFLSRKQKILANQVNEPKRRLFSEINQIEPAAITALILFLVTSLATKMMCTSISTRISLTGW